MNSKSSIFIFPFLCYWARRRWGKEIGNQKHAIIVPEGGEGKISGSRNMPEGGEGKKLGPEICPFREQFMFDPLL